MGEIKFRVWDTQDKKMYLQEIEGDDMTQQVLFYNGAFFHPLGKCLKSDKLILMQFTGLKDKNGKEIYEGDILKASWNQGKDYDIVEVKYDGNYMSFELSDKDGEPFSLSDYGSDEKYNIEVIGNIYEEVKNE